MSGFTAFVRSLGPIAAILFVILAVPFGAAQSQESTGADPNFPPTIDATTGEALPVKPKGKATAPQKTAPASKATGGSELQQRVDQLEEQVADIQVVVGTFESLAKGRPAGTSANASGASDLDGRVRDLETRMGQLSTQLSELSQQLRQMNAQPGAKALPAAPQASADGAMVAGAENAPAAAGDDTGFGTTIVSRADGSDPISQVLADTKSPVAAAPGTQLASAEPAPLTPEQSYEGAYGRLLQQDYGGAEQAFRQFLTQFPDSPLASDAQYFLGETLYVRGQYKPAAEAYLKGYSTFRQARRAPDSLLKLAMSLSRLNQKESACNTFTALDTEYPNAPAQVKRRAISERERVGC